MKKIYVLSVIILFATQGFGQFRLNEWVDEIEYERPDSSRWIQVSKFPAQMLLKGMLKFKHFPLHDSLLHKKIEPIIALQYEKSIDSTDLIIYSISALANKPYKVDYNLLGGFPEFSSMENSIIYEGNYLNKGIKHRMIIGYMLHNDLLIEVICDATEGVYNVVKPDFLKFIKSVDVTEERTKP